MKKANNTMAVELDRIANEFLTEKIETCENIVSINDLFSGVKTPELQCTREETH